jgi:hypothetical protein
VDTIAVGNSSATAMAAINEREARLREITNLVIEPGPESLQEKLEELRTFAVDALARATHEPGESYTCHLNGGPSNCMPTQ